MMLLMHHLLQWSIWLEIITWILLPNKQSMFWCLLYLNSAVQYHDKWNNLEIILKGMEDELYIWIYFKTISGGLIINQYSSMMPTGQTVKKIFIVLSTINYEIRIWSNCYELNLIKAYKYKFDHYQWLLKWSKHMNMSLSLVHQN